MQTEFKAAPQLFRPAAWFSPALIFVPLPLHAQSDPTIAQSVLHPASEDAESVTQLFWIMTISGAGIWLIVIGAAIYAVVGRRKPTQESFSDRFILVGGVVFPTVVLAALLIVGLRLLPDWRRDDLPDLRVHVAGEQYWWRLGYELADGSVFETANELHLPVGAEVEFVLTSTDVIHSFWIPALGGKLDMIPGRANVLRLQADQIGTFRGVCAEYCGLSHALMALTVIVETPQDFAGWTAAQSAPASRDTDPQEFIAAGCPACHIVRGLDQGSAVGPDLTHFASRTDMAAGLLPITPENLSAWIDDPAQFKPDAKMPAFDHLPPDQNRAIVAYLMDLQ